MDIDVVSMEEYIMITMSDNKKYCCESNACLQSAFDKLLELHERTITYEQFDFSSMTQVQVKRFFDVECELWALRALIKDCPWCRPNDFKKENEKLLSGDT
jgi:hypothetical protein